MNYLDLPVILNIGITTGDLKIYGKAGAYLGFGMLANVKSDYTYSDSEGGSYTYEYREGIDIGDGAERFNYGLIAGVGAEYKSLFLELKYSIGKTNLWDDSDYTELNQNLGISIGYKFKKLSK